MQIGHYEYAVNDSNVVEIWNLANPDELNRPFIKQPINVDGNPWADKAEAEAWATAYIQELLAAPVEPAE